MAINYNKIRSFCRVFRLILGTSLVTYGFCSGNKWFFLGLIPLIAGIANFCPICLITKKCDLPS